MDDDNGQNIGSLIRKIVLKTSTPCVLPLESHEFKTLRDKIKEDKTNQVIPEFGDEVMNGLQVSSSLGRLAALTLADYFFHRSHAVRLCILENLPDVLKLCCESDPLHYPLPLPKEEADQLKTKSIKILKQWKEKFSAGYEQLQLAEMFLSSSKCVDYESATAEIAAERNRREVEAKKREERQKKVIDIVMNRFQQMQQDVQVSIDECENALNILVPRFESENQRNASSVSTEVQDQLHAIDMIEPFSVVVQPEAPLVTVTEENESLLQVLRDSHITLTKHSGHLSHLLKKLAECGAREIQVRPLVDMKAAVANILSKVDELRLERKPTNGSSSDDDSDDEFEDVTEETIEEFTETDGVPDYIMKAISADIEADKPCCSKHHINLLSSTGTETETPNGVPSVAEEIGAKRTCRARLSDGRLCPRRDSKKCPVHGPIIDRDEEGFPVKEILATKEQRLVGNDVLGDDDYIRDLEAATGMNLSGRSKSKKKGKDIVPEGRAARDRLQKKVVMRTFKKRTKVLPAPVDWSKLQQKLK